MMLPNPNSQVADNEALYRSIMGEHVKLDSISKKLRISANGFNDRAQQPSVDRAILNNNDPSKTQFSKSNYVVMLIAGEVRAEKIENSEAKYVLDVQPKPLPENQAHAIIVPAPEYKGKSVFRNKVRERLARLAERRIVLDPSIT